MNWNELAPHSRVWIYQAERFLTNEETVYVKSACTEFVAAWSSHGTPLHAAIELFHNLFLVVFVDQEHVKASGCSIDKSMQFIKAIENHTGITFTNRQKIAYKQNEEIFITGLNRLNQLYVQGIIDDNTLFFDNLLQDKNSFKLAFLKPLSDSWHNNFLEKKLITS